MVGSIGFNPNTDFAYKAIGYLGNEPLAGAEKSILGEAKCTATGLPLSIALVEGPRALGYKFGKSKVAKTDGGLIKNWKCGSTINGYKDLFTKLGEVGLKEKTSLKDLFSIKGLKKGAGNYTALNKIANPSAYAVKETAKKGFIRTGISKVTTPLGNAYSTIAKTGPGQFLKLGKLGELCKKGNAGVIAVLDGVMETITEVIPAFKNGGAKEGFTQLGKSAVKVAAGTVAFVAGEAGGRAIGTIIGGAIGSIFPGAGTAVGGWIGGLIGGLFGGVFASNMAGKLAKKVTGKPFSEKNAEATKQQQAIEISRDANSVNELKQAVAQKLIQKQQSGKKLTKDDMAMAQSLNAAGCTNSTGSAAVPFGSLNTAAQANADCPTSQNTTPVQEAKPLSFDVPAELREKYVYTNPHSRDLVGTSQG